MNTPIWDFVNKYIKKDYLRLHMPGHKGSSLLGFEPYDITEFEGADSLYEASGIIKKSEENASQIFGCHTLYSTEGSSQCIRAMLYLAVQMSGNKKPLIAAGRNAHKTFLSAAALLDFDIDWLMPKSSSYLSCNITPEYMEHYFKTAATLPFAVYLTSPDYLGNMPDIKTIAEICHKYGSLLLVDNAHGAYLNFLQSSRHPIDLGADLCTDSAHKTLPVLTGGAYLHISNTAPAEFKLNAKKALAMFGSTSPSYLILQSLDKANEYLENYPEKLAEFIPKLKKLRSDLEDLGYTLLGDEPLKITVDAKAYGYKGFELAGILAEKNIMVEFADPDFVTMMFTPMIPSDSINRLYNAFKSIPKIVSKLTPAPEFSRPEKALSVREAAFAPSETLDIKKCEGKILAAATVGCPPAVPIVVCGEIIDKSAIELFEYYGIETCEVLK